MWYAPATITVPAGITLTVNDGAVLKFEPNTSTLLSVLGNLVVGDPGVVGQEGVGPKAIFTSFLDDSVEAGGDSNGDLNASVPSRGNWSRIEAGNNSTINMDNAIVRYSDYGIRAFATAPAAFSVINSDLSDFDNYGFELHAAGNVTYTIKNVNITNTAFDDGIGVFYIGARTKPLGLTDPFGF